MKAAAALRDIVSRNRAGEHIGIASWCTANADALRAILRARRGDDAPILIEATCNQVNQHGGYTGMNPAGFRDFIFGLAGEMSIDADRIVLGGDHLGPNPWKHLPASSAMEQARDMIRAYVEAGFTKIHLDASMACNDDVALGEPEMAARAASLCEVAERYRAENQLVYVIGTEVPIPGGETAALDTLAVTRPEAALRTVELHRAAFASRGLDEAFARVIGVVVQPGVDFDNSQVFAYDRSRAACLSEVAGQMPGAVFEAHSTDYQSAEALSDLVATHFAILKVGPELTFAYREAIVAMACIEDRLDVSQKSNIFAVVDRVMGENPRHWRAYIEPSARREQMKLFGLSDRVRYYWPNAEIVGALRILRANLDDNPVEVGLLSQFAGDIGADTDTSLSARIINARVGTVVKKYMAACRP